MESLLASTRNLIVGGVEVEWYPQQILGELQASAFGQGGGRSDSK